MTTNKLAFFMFTSQYRLYYPEKIIPVFIDTRVGTFNNLIEGIKDINTAIITNKQACEKAKEIYPEKNLYSIPLWCSNKWKINVPPKKTIDVLQIGRKNHILHTFMLKYIENNSSVEYIYQKDNSNDYISTTRGNIGQFISREDYMNKLREAKICLVSSPLVDSDSHFDFITPRVYETAMSYCYMIGRFTKNSEFEEVGLERVVDLVYDYKTFELYMTRYLQTEDFIKRDEFDQFIRDNSFENRYKKLSQILEEIENS